MSMRQLKISKSITSRESESLEKYLQEISKIKLLPFEEEVKLAICIKNGDETALNTLTKANLRFVVSVAKQYQNQGLTLPDLINEGNVGLIKAAQRFDETKGFKFISYAVWWIRQSIIQALAEQSRIIRLPLNKVGLAARVNKAYSHLEQELEREPTSEEVATFLKMNIEEVDSVLCSEIRHVSMDQPLQDGEDNTLIDVMCNPNATSTDNDVAFNQSLKTEIERFLTMLSIRQKEIIRLFFGIGLDTALSLDDIGKKFQLTRERVRQIKDKGIAKLRSAARCKILKSYLGT